MGGGKDGQWGWGQPGRHPHPPGLWQAPPLGAGGGALLPGALEQQQPQFVSRFLEGQSGVTIKHVACGDLFTACLTGEALRGPWEGPPKATSLIALSFAKCTLDSYSALLSLAPGALLSQSPLPFTTGLAW